MPLLGKASGSKKTYIACPDASRTVTIFYASLFI
jgi:hypothetical protein